MTIEELNEYFNTDSIKRKKVLGQALEDSIHSYLISLYPFLENGNGKGWGAWYFPDAEEGEVGTMDDYVTSDKIEVSVESYRHGKMLWGEDITFSTNLILDK